MRTQQENITLRFQGADWFGDLSQFPPIIIGGCGGIGSWTSFFLTRAGFEVVCFDDDIIEEHNLGGQLYSANTIGDAKVDAMSGIIGEYSRSGSFIGRKERIENTLEIKTRVSPFCISAFDNMKARRDLFDLWKEEANKYYEEMRMRIKEEQELLATLISDSLIKKQQKVLEDLYQSPVPFFIDGRLEVEQMQVFFVTLNEVDEYEKHLFDDANVPELSCSLKQTSHSSAMIGSTITALFTNHIVNCKYNMVKGIRSTPFYTEYFSPLVHLITKN